MAKTLFYRLLLILFLITRSNYGYTWSCSFNQTSDGWYLEESMVCDGIAVDDALENHYCEWFRPSDPYCSIYQEPTCVDLTETRTTSCDINYSGGVQESRFYTCGTQSWTPWQIVSSNCTPNPPSCVSSSDSRTLQCSEGYTGQITETRISSCPDPYGTEVWTDWLESQNSCTQTMTNVENPVSPVSPLNPVSPIQIDTATAPQIDVQVTNDVVDQQIESVVNEELHESSENVDNNTNDKTDSTKDVKQNKQDRNDKQSKQDKDEVVDDSEDVTHEILPGFGVVLSLDILAQPMTFYQPPLQDQFKYEQDFTDEFRTAQEYIIELLKQDDSTNHYLRNSDNTWSGIRRSDVFQ